MDLLYIIGALVIGMYLAWDFIPRPTWLPKLSNKTTYSGTGTSTIGMTEIIAGITALAAILQSGLFKNSTGVIGKLRDLVVGISKVVGLARYKVGSAIIGKNDGEK